ncbi:hypothetical protein [Prosthecochloris sp.]|uniref:hypothetical protein n=1 Tax=Prosthecochloris sp. TaxID=290513 RepID=UPI00257FDB37|nr:hypothetical protein [Prosthecochloris sp.]
MSPILLIIKEKLGLSDVETIEQIKEFDAASYLNSDEMIVEYLKVGPNHISKLNYSRCPQITF